MKNENEIGHLKKKTCKKLDEKIAKLIFLSLFSFFFSLSLRETKAVEREDLQTEDKGIEKESA